jgi:hypothetical protein
MSAEDSKHWQLEKVHKDGEVDARVREASGHTSSDVKLAGHAIGFMRDAGQYVSERRWTDGYLDKLRAFVVKGDARAAGQGRYAFQHDLPKAEDYAVLIAEVRENFPHLDGHIGRFIMPDTELKELIDGAWNERKKELIDGKWKENKINFRMLFAKALSRAAHNGGFRLSVSAVLKYLYRAPRKQAKAGRPRKNHSIATPPQ